jgi:hypothetical protein
MRNFDLAKKKRGPIAFMEAQLITALESKGKRPRVYVGIKSKSGHRAPPSLPNVAAAAPVSSYLPQPRYVAIPTSPNPSAVYPRQSRPVPDARQIAAELSMMYLWMIWLTSQNLCSTCIPISIR